jgi:ferric-dicitrate binding protein FerR (iron transport regulator)
VPVLLHFWIVVQADYRSPLGEVTAVELPDGSKVWLDAGPRFERGLAATGATWSC